MEPAVDASSSDSSSPKPDASIDAPPQIPFTEATPFEPAGPLCDIPPGYVTAGGDPHAPPCMIAVGKYRDPMLAPKKVLRVVAWNVEFGKDTPSIMTALTTRPQLMSADILLLSEVPRRSLTSNPDDVDLAKDIAMQLGMSYAFAVEWDRREKAGEGGEHGVAVLSRYPIGAPRMIRHAKLNDWYGDEQLYGGRVSVGVDILVGNKLLAAYVSHFDTRGIGDTGRALQASELRVDTLAPGRPQIMVIGGDYNTWTCNPFNGDCTQAPDAEKAIEDFIAGGWANGTGNWNGVTHFGEGFIPQRLDWLFFKAPGATTGGVDNQAEGSDHLPIYFDVKLE